MTTAPIEVLLLEDDEEESLLLQATLGRAAPGQFKFTLVPCLNDALELLQTRGFDVVLMDLNLPDSLGIDTFRRIRTRAASIPVLVCSGLADEAMAIEAVQLGAQDYLIKGESKGGQVVRAIRYALERDKLQKAQVATIQPKKGKTVAFIGVKGGVGTTTVAVNVAAALACKEHRVTLVELHPSFGTLSVQLGRNRPATNLRHSLDRGVADFNDRDLIVPLVSTVPNLRVLFGPQAAEEFAAIDPEQAVALLHTLVGMADFTVFDLPAQPSPASAAVMRNCDYVAIVAERDGASMAAAKVFLEALRTWEVSGERIGAVLVNRGGTSLPLEVHSLKSELKCSIIGIVHHAGDALMISQRACTPLVIAQSEHLAAEMFCEIAQRLQVEPVAAISF